MKVHITTRQVTMHPRLKYRCLLVPLRRSQPVESSLLPLPQTCLIRLSGVQCLSSRREPQLEHAVETTSFHVVAAKARRSEKQQAGRCGYTHRWLPFVVSNFPHPLVSARGPGADGFRAAVSATSGVSICEPCGDKIKSVGSVVR